MTTQQLPPKHRLPLAKTAQKRPRFRSAAEWAALGVKVQKWPEIYPVQSERRPWPSTMQRRRLRSLLVAMTGCANWNATVRCLRPFKYSSMETASTVGTSYPSPGLPNHIRRSSCPKHNTKMLLAKVEGLCQGRVEGRALCNTTLLLTAMLPTENEYPSTGS